MLNIGQVIDISNITVNVRPLSRTGSLSHLLCVEHKTCVPQKSPCGSELARDKFHVVRGLRPDTKWLTSLNPGVEECPGTTSESMNASSSAVILTAWAFV